MKRTEKRTQIYLPSVYHGFVNDIAAEYHTSMSEVIRMLIKREMEHHRLGKDPLDDLGTRGTSLGRPDGSANVDRYLYGKRKDRR